MPARATPAYYHQEWPVPTMSIQKDGKGQQSSPSAVGMVSWEEVLLNDKIRTDDAEMRAEMESLRNRLSNEVEARTQLFRQRRQADCTRVERRMRTLCLRSAFREWSNAMDTGKVKENVDFTQKSPEQLHMLAQRNHVLTAELNGLVRELQKDEARMESSEEDKRLLVARLRHELSKLVEQNTKDFHVPPSPFRKDNDTPAPLASDELTWLRAFRFVFTNLQTLMATTSTSEEDVILARLSASDPSNPLVAPVCSALLILKRTSSATSPTKTSPSHRSPREHGRRSSPYEKSQHSSIHSSRGSHVVDLQKEIARLELEGRGLFLDVCTLEDNNTQLCAGLLEAIATLQKLGSKSDTLEALLPLGKPLRSRQGGRGTVSEDEEQAEWRSLFEQWEGEEGLPALSSSSSDGGASGEEAKARVSRGSGASDEGVHVGSGDAAPRKKAKRMVHRREGGDARAARDALGGRARARHRQAKTNAAEPKRVAGGVDREDDVQVRVASEVHRRMEDKTYLTGRVYSHGGWQVDENLVPKEESKAMNLGIMDDRDSKCVVSDTRDRARREVGLMSMMAGFNTSPVNHTTTPALSSVSSAQGTLSGVRYTSLPVQREIRDSNVVRYFASAPPGRDGGFFEQQQGQAVHDHGLGISLGRSMDRDSRSSVASLDAALMHSTVLSRSFDSCNARAEQDNSVTDGGGVAPVGGWSVNAIVDDQVTGTARNAIMRAEVGVYPTMSSTPRSEREVEKDDMSWLTSMKTQFTATKQKAKQLRSLL